MKSRRLLHVTVTTSVEAEDAVTELLATVFGNSPAIYTDEETQVTLVSVYCAKRGDWDFDKHWQITLGLSAMRAAGLDIGAGTVEARSVRREDWAESWKRHFKPIEIGDRLLIKPSWIKRQPRKPRCSNA